MSIRGKLQQTVRSILLEMVLYVLVLRVVVAIVLSLPPVLRVLLNLHTEGSLRRARTPLGHFSLVPFVGRPPVSS